MTDNSTFAFFNPTGGDDVRDVTAIFYAASAVFLSYFELFRRCAVHVPQVVGAILRRQSVLVAAQFPCFPPFMAIV
jgi:hypothetical protein